MADRIQLRLGHAPWLPTEDSELAATYRYYDGPLTGVIRQHGNDYVFSCLDGQSETLSLWYYAPIKPEQRLRLEALPTQEFSKAFSSEMWEGCIVLAFATEQLGIVDYETVEDHDDYNVLTARLEQALNRLRERLSDLSSDAEGLAVTSV